MAELRPPTLEERKAGLPKTKQEAIDAGLTRFIPEDGKERVIRGYGSKLTPGGHVKMASSRKATSGNRRIAEDMATPDEATKRAADKSMANMRSRGNVGHHRFPVSYLAAGEREQPGTIEAYKRVQVNRILVILLKLLMRCQLLIITDCITWRNLLCGVASNRQVLKLMKFLHYVMLHLGDIVKVKLAMHLFMEMLWYAYMLLLMS